MYYRATEYTSTGETPNAMVFGRGVSQPFDLQFRFLYGKDKILAPKYVVELQERLIKTHQVMEQKLVNEAWVAKKYYEKMRASWNGPYVVITVKCDLSCRHLSQSK